MAELNITETLSETGRALFKECLAEKRFQRRDSVIEKGDSVSGAYFVIEGVLRVYTLSPDGKQATLYLLRPGETCVLALNALFNDYLYPAWVEAEEDTVVGILPGPVYRTLFATEKPVQQMTIKALASAVYGLISTLDQNILQSVDQRLASYLLLNANSKGELHNTQQEIAQHIGTSREVVGRIMGRFSKSEMIRTDRGKVTLLDRPKLNKVG